MASRARSVLEDVEVRRLLVAQVPLVAVAGAAVAAGLAHVKTQSGTHHLRLPPGGRVVL